MARDFNTPPLPLDALTLHPRQHRAALWWSWWCYRNPRAFESALGEMSHPAKRRLALVLFLHLLPWLLLLALALSVISGALVDLVNGQMSAFPLRPESGSFSIRRWHPSMVEHA